MTPQPIETAPKDGTPILVWDGKVWLAAVWHHESHLASERVTFADGTFDLVPKTHTIEGWQAVAADQELYDYHGCPCLVRDAAHWLPMPPPPA